MIFEVRAVEVGRENRSKINQKTQSKMERLLKCIFSRFGWIWEAKLGCKIHPNRSDLAWRGVMARRGEAWRGVARRGVARRGVEGVKGVKGGSARPRPEDPSGLALLKGVDRCENYPPCVEDLKC